MQITKARKRMDEAQQRATELVKAAKTPLATELDSQRQDLDATQIQQACEAAIRYKTMEVFHEYATPAGVLGLIEQRTALYVALKTIVKSWDAGKHEADRIGIKYHTHFGESEARATLLLVDQKPNLGE